MEKKLVSFKDVKVGQLFLIENPIFGDELVVCASIGDSVKYPIQQDGRKLRMVTDETNGGVKPVYADDMGDTGDEMIKEYCFLSENGGDYMFKEDDKIFWNIRRIDKKHPKYNDEFSKHGVQFNSMLTGFMNLI